MPGDYSPGSLFKEDTMKSEPVIENQSVIRWYFYCIRELHQHFRFIYIDDIAFDWLQIIDFPLPNTFFQSSSTLLLKLPGENIENHYDYDFYMDLDLNRMDGQQTKHLIDGIGYNLYQNQGYCRLSYHLQNFNPTLPINNGDTLLDICQSLYHFLSKKW